MNSSEFQSRLTAGIGGPDLWNLRKETAFYTTQRFSLVGMAMASRTDLTGDDGESVRAMGLFYKWPVNSVLQLAECYRAMSTMRERLFYDRLLR